jgi:hypothetical protein
MAYIYYAKTQSLNINPCAMLLKNLRITGSGMHPDFFADIFYLICVVILQKTKLL